MHTAYIHLQCRHAHILKYYTLIYRLFDICIRTCIAVHARCKCKASTQAHVVCEFRMISYMRGLFLNWPRACAWGSKLSLSLVLYTQDNQSHPQYIRGYFELTAILWLCELVLFFAFAHSKSPYCTSVKGREHTELCYSYSYSYRKDISRESGRGPMNRIGTPQYPTQTPFSPLWPGQKVR